MTARDDLKGSAFGDTIDDVIPGCAGCNRDNGTGCALQYAANLARRDDHVGKGAQTLRKLAAYQGFAAHHKMWRRKHLKKDGAGRWVPKKKSGPKKTIAKKG